MISILFLVTFYVIYGYFEANLFSRGFHSGKNDIFGIINSHYHLPMFVFLATPTVLLGFWYLIPTLLIVEDQSYFLFELRDELDPEDWIARLLGSQRILGVLIPNIYFALLGSSIVLFWCDYLAQCFKH
jgi:hypothetical protein